MALQDNEVIRTLRAQAWERAKGELRAMLQTYWGESEKYDQAAAEVGRFIDEIEGEGYHE